MNDMRSILNAVRAEKGTLTPRSVLEAARAEDHPLHADPQWLWDDDRAAAERYRLGYAHKLIQLARIPFESAETGLTEIRYYRAVRADDADEYEYEPIDEILADPLRRKLVLRDMKRQISELVAAFEQFEEFWAEMRKVSRRKKAG